MNSDFERNEAAMLYGLVTAAYIAKKNGYSFHDFIRAVMLSSIGSATKDL